MAAAVVQLPDFSHRLSPDYRKDYQAWRLGKPRSWRTGRQKGSKGEVDEIIAQVSFSHNLRLRSKPSALMALHTWLTPGLV